MHQKTEPQRILTALHCYVSKTIDYIGTGHKGIYLSGETIVHIQKISHEKYMMCEKINN